MNNSTENKKLEYLQVKEKFQRVLIQELLTHTQKIIENYKKLIEQMQTSSSLDRELKNLNKDIIGIYYSDINSRKHSVKLIRNKIKVFNKSYNKRLYTNNNLKITNIK